MLQYLVCFCSSFLEFETELYGNTLLSEIWRCQFCKSHIIQQWENKCLAQGCLRHWPTRMYDIWRRFFILAGVSKLHWHSENSGVAPNRYCIQYRRQRIRWVVHVIRAPEYWEKQCNYLNHLNWDTKSLNIANNNNRYYCYWYYFNFHYFIIIILLVCATSDFTLEWIKLRKKGDALIWEEKLKVTIEMRLTNSMAYY